MYFNRIKDIYNNNGNIPDLWRDVQEAHKHGTTYTSSQTDGQTDKQTDMCVYGYVNPIPAGVLKNQNARGGGQLAPTLNPMFYVQL